MHSHYSYYSSHPSPLPIPSMMPITSIHYTHLLQSIPHSHIPYTHFSLTSFIQSIGSTPTFSHADHILPFTPIKPIFITPLPLVQLIHTHASLITFLMPLITPYSVTHPIHTHLKYPTYPFSSRPTIFSLSSFH